MALKIFRFLKKMCICIITHVLLHNGQELEENANISKMVPTLDVNTTV